VEPPSTPDDDEKRIRRGTILFPTDYSAGTRAGFNLACQIAQDSGNRLVVMHATEQERAGSSSFAPLPPLSEGHRNAWEKRLGFVMPRHPAIPIEHRQEQGDVVCGILKVARETPCEMILMSGPQRSRLGRLLMGSITGAVGRAAPCPVLKLNSHGDEVGRRRDMLKFKTIIHATDFSKPAMYAFELAQTLARASDCQLLVVHVASMENFRDRGQRLEMYEALHCLVSSNPHVHMRHLLLAGDPSGQIICSAKQLDCDLIVMGTHGHTGLKGLLLGSVASAVKKEASCPILTVQVPDQKSWELPEFANVQALATAEGAHSSGALSLQANGYMA
jgi:nucleotide-binding universal stress UspA family protein